MKAVVRRAYRDDAAKCPVNPPLRVMASTWPQAYTAPQLAQGRSLEHLPPASPPRGRHRDGPDALPPRSVRHPTVH
jgi:hypothetical protein